MGIVELMAEQKKGEARAEEKAADVAKAMLMEGDPISKIARVTDLSEAETQQTQVRSGARLSATRRRRQAVKEL